MLPPPVATLLVLSDRYPSLPAAITECNILAGGATVSKMLVRSAGPAALHFRSRDSRRRLLRGSTLHRSGGGGVHGGRIPDLRADASPVGRRLRSSGGAAGGSRSHLEAHTPHLSVGLSPDVASPGLRLSSRVRITRPVAHHRTPRSILPRVLRLNCIPKVIPEPGVLPVNMSPQTGVALVEPLGIASHHFEGVSLEFFPPITLILLHR